MAKEKNRKFFRNSKFNPKKTREGEKIGGGWWVFRRGDDTGRIRVPVWPYEHESKQDAQAQAVRLAAKFPGEIFVVAGQIGGTYTVDAEGDLHATLEAAE